MKENNMCNRLSNTVTEQSPGTRVNPTFRRFVHYDTDAYLTEPSEGFLLQFLIDKDIATLISCKNPNAYKLARQNAR